MNRAVFVFGASAVGKTAVAQHLDKRAPWAGEVYYFDSIGVPSGDQMIQEHGSGEGWQQWATEQWVQRLSHRDVPLQLLEGQTRPSFITQALQHVAPMDAVLILLNCSAEVRLDRLHHLRGHPELATPQMESWSAYLRGQADALDLPVIDTDELGVAEVAARVEAIALDGVDSNVP